MDITHHLKIKATATTIYDAVSSREGIKGWWSADCEVGTAVGSASTLKFNKQGTLVVMGFKTLELRPGKRVEWVCTAMPNPAWIGTKIITEIKELNGSCEVTFSHTGFDEKWKGQGPFEETKATWNHFINSLVSFCEGGEGQPW